MKKKYIIYFFICSYPSALLSQFVGGGADGHKLSSNLTYCVPASLPTLTNVSLGGTADGHSRSENLTYCVPASLPTLTNVSLGGTADGHSLSENLTYCVPASLPTLDNIALGGTADGHSLSENLTYCVPAALPSITNIALGGSSDGNFLDEGACLAVSLPIELLYFDAILQKNNTVLCKWKTQTEINNDYFIIEKTKDVEKYQLVATINAAGNSNLPQTYSIIDSNPFSGISYYRLKQVDNNGDYSYSDLRAINLQGIDIINMSPNPAENEITVMLYSSEQTKVNINIYNVLGQKISLAQELAIEKGTNYIITDVSSFNFGYYMIEVTTLSGLYRVQKKLIKSCKVFD